MRSAVTGWTVPFGSSMSSCRATVRNTTLASFFASSSRASLISPKSPPPATARASAIRLSSSRGAGRVPCCAHSTITAPCSVLWSLTPRRKDHHGRDRTLVEPKGGRGRARRARAHDRPPRPREALAALPRRIAHAPVPDRGRARRARAERGALMSGYVIVTTVNDLVHVYGDRDGDPFPTRAKAQTHARKMLERDQEFYPGGDTIGFHVRKILGGLP